ncbi:MAG: hypothetical protein ACE5K3_00885 [bacterium]
MERLAEIREWAKDCTKFDLEVAKNYLVDWRDSCRRTVKENSKSSTKPEQLLVRSLNLLIMKLEALQVGRR